jgi:hypothetical protein
LSVLGSAFAIVEFLVSGVLCSGRRIGVLGACGLHCILFGNVSSFAVHDWFFACNLCIRSLFESHFTGALLPPLLVCSVAHFLAGVALVLVPHSALWCTKIILVLMEVEVGMVGFWRAGLQRGLVYLGYLVEVRKRRVSCLEVRITCCIKAFQPQSRLSPGSHGGEVV